MSGNEVQATDVKVGFSPKFDTPEFQEAVRQSSHHTTMLWVGLALAIPLVFPAIGIVGAATGAAKNPSTILGFAFGGAVLTYLITIPITVFLLVKRNNAKQWDGEVVDLLHYVSDNGDSYYIVCRTDDGREQKVRDYGHSLYDYLQVGDRVRFHPRLNVPLEKFDKTHDTYLPCPFCGKSQALDANDCAACGRPLLR